MILDDVIYVHMFFFLGTCSTRVKPLEVYAIGSGTDLKVMDGS